MVASNHKFLLSPREREGAMKGMCLAVLIVLSPAVAMADKSVILISPVAEFTNPDGIATNVKVECRLETYQAEMVRREMESRGIPVKLSDNDVVSGEGRFLLLRIENAISVGNAFIGHRKHVMTSAKLFENGKEIARSTQSRDSMGGMGLKGSCAVLERCANTLAKDITGWLQGQLAKQSAAEPAAPAK